MKPILYAKTATDLSGSGLGTLDECIAATVTEKRNGSYEAKFVYPLNGALFASIGYDSIVKMKPADGMAAQPFRVYRVSKPISGKVTFSCEHISYILNKKIVPPITLTGKTALQIYNACAAAAIDTCGFTFAVDGITGTENYESTGYKTMREVVFDLLELFGGELEWGAGRVTLHASRGSDRGAGITHGVNMTSVTYDGDTTDLYTAIYPYYGTDDNLITLPEHILTSSTHGNYAYERILPMDFTEYFTDTPTVTELRSMASDYMADSEQFVVKENIKASFIPLNKTTEYISASVPNVNLCDLVTVSHPTLGISKKAKIIALTYNVLGERPETVELGTKKSDLSNLADDINKIAKKLAEKNSNEEAPALGWYTGDYDITDQYKAVLISELNAVNSIVGGPYPNDVIDDMVSTAQGFASYVSAAVSVTITISTETYSDSQSFIRMGTSASHLTDNIDAIGAAPADYVPRGIVSRTEHPLMPVLRELGGIARDMPYDNDLIDTMMARGQTLLAEINDAVPFTAALSTESYSDSQSYIRLRPATHEISPYLPDSYTRNADIGGRTIEMKFIPETVYIYNNEDMADEHLVYTATASSTVAKATSEGLWVCNYDANYRLNTVGVNYYFSSVKNNGRSLIYYV